ncbi:MAG: SLC13 family permease [Planctomycetota bacterium]
MRRDDSRVSPRRLLIALAIGILCWWLGILLPFGPGADPARARLVLGVTGLTTACWLGAAMPLGAASLLPLALLPLFGVQPMKDVARGFAHPILWLFGGGFVLAQAIEKWGLHRRMSLSVLRWVGPNPRRLVSGFFLAAAMISLWINNTSVSLMLLPIGWALVDRAETGGLLRGRDASNFGACIMLGIAYGASLGGMGTPIGTAPNALYFGNYQSLVDAGAPAMSFLQWLLAFLPFVALLTILFAWLLTSVILPVPKGMLGGAGELLAEARSLGRVSAAERRVAMLFSAAVLLWVTRADVRFGDFEVHGWAYWLLPGEAGSDFIPDGVVAVAAAIAAFLIPSGDGRALMDWPTVQKMPFDILFLLGAGMALAGAFDPSGLSAAFGNLLAPMIGRSHPLLVIAVLCVIMLLLSELASNTAVAALFLPILKQGAVHAGMDPRVLMLPATLAASCGFMLPIATPPNTVVFASGRVSVGQMARAGLALDALSIALLIAAMWFWVLPLLGVDPATRPDWLPPK